MGDHDVYINIILIMPEDGTPEREDEQLAFSNDHGLKLLLLLNIYIYSSPIIQRYSSLEGKKFIYGQEPLDQTIRTPQPTTKASQNGTYDDQFDYSIESNHRSWDHLFKAQNNQVEVGLVLTSC